MAEKTIRIGIIGAGANTRAKHLPNLQRIDGVEALAVCNRRPESTARAARDFAIPRTCASWREVTDSPDVDAVVIGTWPYLHCEATCAALQAGKHVLCEARMAMNAHEAHRMLDALDAAGGLVGQIVPSGVGLRVHKVVKRLIESGCVGEPRELYVRSLNSTYLDPHLPLHWRQDERLSGLNVLELGIFNETIQRWLGDTASVMASTRVFTGERADSRSGEARQVTVPDSLTVLSELECGTHAVYHMSGVAHAAGEARIEIYGSEGTLVYLPGPDSILGARRPEGELGEIPVPPAEAFEWTVERDFIASIREGKPVGLTSFEDGVKYMEFTEAVHRSARSGAKVALPLGGG